MDATPRVKAAVALLLGLLWAGRSLHSFAEPNFTDPQTVADWWAVVSLSLALALLPAGVHYAVGLQEPSATRRILVALIGAAAVTAAVSNLLEDAAGVDWAATPYFFGLVVAMPGMIVLAFVCLGRRPRWLALVLILTVTGMVNMEIGGGVLVLLVWVPVAVVLGRPTPD